MPEHPPAQARQPATQALPTLIDEWLAHLDPALEAEEPFEDFYALLQASRSHPNACPPYCATSL